MEYIYVVFDNEYDDVDILSVPNEIAENIDLVVQQFFNWLCVPENANRFLIPSQNGHMVLGIGTKEFLWWLNSVKITGTLKAELITQHTTLQHDFPIAEF